MLNDVHAPPLEPKQTTSPVHREIPGHHHPARPDRAHSLERTADHGMGTELVINPEERGDSFNTMMSAVIVGTVLTIVAVVAWMIFA